MRVNGRKVKKTHETGRGSRAVHTSLDVGIRRAFDYGGRRWDSGVICCAKAASFGLLCGARLVRIHSHRCAKKQAPIQRLRLVYGGRRCDLGVICCAKAASFGLLCGAYLVRIHSHRCAKKQALIQRLRLVFGGRRCDLNVICCAKAASFGLLCGARLVRIHSHRCAKKQAPIQRLRLVFGGRRWIRTIEARRNRFTVCPLWPLGNPPI